MRALILLCMVAVSVAVEDGPKNKGWWRSMSLYQIYPRSFKDGNGDGVGDLKGITNKLLYFKEIGVNAFWLSPFYPSPMIDFGYDIADFNGVDPVFGTMTDFENMVKRSHELNLKVIIDLVPNHSSDKHEWFQKSLQNIPPYNDFFVWRSGKKLSNGTIAPPNNWVSALGGHAWKWREERQAFYLHQFMPEEPDLNYRNPKVAEEMKNVLRFWLNKGVDGFRIDSAAYLWEHEDFPDEPPSGKTDDPYNINYPDRIYTKDQPQTYDIIKSWREVLDEYKDSERIMMIEAYTNMTSTMKYYTSGAHFPFNFAMIANLTKNSSAADFHKMINNWMEDMPSGGDPNWVAGNHDNPRPMTRLGSQRARVATLITLILPGVSVTYNGDEIGMPDAEISWEDTKDPLGCVAGKEGYKSTSRDPARTPFQWDRSKAAGFSTNSSTWLPINKNYKTVNLAIERRDTFSYFHYYKALAKLKKTPIVQTGTLDTKLINANVLAIARETKDGSLYAVANLGKKTEMVDLSVFDNVSNELQLYYATKGDGAASVLLPKKNKVKVVSGGIVIYVTKGVTVQDLEEVPPDY
ncbi:alpha-glucosidase-like [Colletes gigas]|uniref:alpha-glucosidase-like n=1 Tax=Colletes gigas TaxID=935657 RepID=UPI001C9AC654|nr:alpha-glucosidase-like [Colletes gigas]